MKNLICIVLLFAASVGYAQHIAPIGSVWHYRKSGSAGNPVLDVINRLEATKDTVIDGKAYRVLEYRQLRKDMRSTYLESYYFNDSAGYVTFWYQGAVYPFFNFNAIKGTTVRTSQFEPFDRSFATIDVQVDSVYIDDNGFKTYLLGQPYPKVVKQQVFQDRLTFLLLELVRIGARPMEGGSILRCFNNGSFEIKPEAGPCDSIPYHRFNDKIQYYYSMWKPYSVREAPYFRLIKDTAGMPDQFWLRYDDQHDIHNSSGDVLCKEDVPGRKLYVWKEGWHVLYDFSAAAGDTVTSVAITHPLHILNKATGYESIQQFRYVIDSVYEHDHRLVQIPRALPGELWTIPGRIYEGIGSDVALLGWPTQYDTTGREGHLRCFFNSDWGLSFINPKKDVEQCYSVLTGLENPAAKGPAPLRLYPNPASTVLEFTYATGSEWAKVYDATGKCKGTFSGTTLDVSQWTDGVYFMVVYDGSFYTTGTFAVQH